MPVYYKYKFIFYFNVTVAIVFILIYVHFYWYFSSVYKIVLHIYEAHFFISCYVRVVCAGIHRADLKLIKLLIMTPQRTNETVVSLSPLLFLFGVKLVGDAVTSAVSFSSPEHTGEVRTAAAPQTLREDTRWMRLMCADIVHVSPLTEDRDSDSLSLLYNCLCMGHFLPVCQSKLIYEVSTIF